jgi:hypothetical protein
VVGFEAAGEGVQVGLVVGFDGLDPVVEAVAVQAGEDLGELGDVPGEGIQVGAAFPGLREPGLLVLVQGVRVLQDPAGQLAGVRSGPCNPRRLTVLAIAGEAPAAVFCALRVARAVQRRRPRIAAGSALVVAGSVARLRAASAEPLR